MYATNRRYLWLFMFSIFMFWLTPWRMAEAFIGNAYPLGNYFPGFIQMQTQAQNVYSQQLANHYFLGRSGLAGALITGTGISGVNPAITQKPIFIEVCSGCKSGFAFEPNPNAVWDPAYGGWRMPLVDQDIKGWEIIFRLKPNGSQLIQAPIPGAPWPELMILNRRSVRGDLPSFTVEMDIRATDKYGQDKEVVYFEGNSPTSFYQLGLWIQYAETAAGSGVWEAGTSPANVAVFSDGGSAGRFPVTFDATTCNITSSRTGGTSAYTPTKNISLMLGSVPPSAFTGDGSTSDGGDHARGELRITCLKYSHENIHLTLSSSSEPAVPAQGVVLSEPSIGGRSSNVGIQLLYCLSDLDYGDARLGVLSCPVIPFPLGVDVGSARTPGINFYQMGGSYRFGGKTYIDPDIDVGVTHIYLLARYYQVGTGTAQAGVVQTNYTLTLDNI